MKAAQLSVIKLSEFRTCDIHEYCSLSSFSKEFSLGN